jgi:hypothetical protein
MCRKKPIELVGTGLPQSLRKRDQVEIVPITSRPWLQARHQVARESD